MPYWSDYKEYPAIYGRDVGCLEDDVPCFGEPILLFWLPLASDLGPGQEGDANSNIFDTAWSPDGRRIAFIAYGSAENEFDLFISDWNGENMRNITSSPDKELSVSWSSDGRILYTARSEDINGLHIHTYVIDSSGENRTELTLGDIVYSAMWMPDGAAIVFEGTVDERWPQIFVCDANGENVRQITHSFNDSIQSDFTTDGQVVFFRRDDITSFGISHDIYRVNIDGSDEIVFIASGVGRHAWDLSIAPFGGWLAFSKESTITSNMDIFLVSLDGETTIPVTFGGYYEAVIDWRVIRYP